MSRSCAHWRGEIGAYIVGAIDSAGRDRVTRHLAACTGCRADYDDIVPVRNSLDLLALAADEPGSGRPPRGPLPDPGQQARFRRARRSPAGRRWQAAAGTAAAAAVAAIALLLSSGAPAARTFQAADIATGVSGRAQLHATPAGTRIDLTATGLTRDERCRLIAVTRQGTDVAGSWAATYDGSARMAGTTAFRSGQLTALRIESDTGLLLLSIRL